jgi:iron-sulfur cluster assembly accessory protein
MMQMTDRAVEKVKELMAKEDKVDHGLRVAVKGGGCSGFQYGLFYEKDNQDDDKVLEFDGLKVFIDPMSVQYLEEVTVDYVDGLSGAGFKIDNPKASGSCGCGSSFSV